MEEMARAQNLEVMKSELGTKPRVYYRNLWRYNTCFIGGTVSAEARGAVDCVEGAKVRLLRGSALIGETVTNNYGDFKFDRLEDGSGTYVIEVSATGRAKKTVEAKLGTSINVGEIRV